MRERAALLAAALLVLVACQPTAPTPIPPQPNIVVNVPISVNVGTTPGTGASPIPGAGGQLVFGVKAAEFGERCPTGVIPAEGGENRVTRVGCTSAVTISPTDASGREIEGEDARHQLVAFRQLGGNGAGQFEQDGKEPYNGSVFCKTTGVVVLEGSIRDVATNQVFTGGDGGNRNVPWSMNCVS